MSTQPRIVLMLAGKGQEIGQRRKILGGAPRTDRDPDRNVSPWVASRAKRGLDIVASLLGIVLLSPIMTVTAVAVRVNMGSPVLFRQLRPGREGRVFEICKFRTMTNETDDDGNLRPPEERLTVFGRMLRSTSLDEVPELFNVLRGEMSLVGPRPLRIEYTPHYSDEQLRRLKARPGITGAAQVAGRNLLEWEDRFALDVDYVDSATPWTDLSVLLLTIGQVLRRGGVEPADGGISQPFANTRLDS